MAIPPKEQMTGNNTTEAQFKSGMNNIVDYLSDVDAQSLTFGTTAELKLAKPKIGQKAKTLDSGKVWEWKGSAAGWVDTGEGELERANKHTDEQLDALDSYRVNSGKNYPFLRKVRAGVDFNANNAMISAVLDIKIYGADPRFYYRLEMIENGNTSFGGNGHGVRINKYPISTYETAGNSTTIHQNSSINGLDVDYASKGIQKQIIKCDNDDVIFEIVLDVDKMPAFGTAMAATNDRTTGYNWIIDPICCLEYSEFQKKFDLSKLGLVGVSELSMRYLTEYSASHLRINTQKNYPMQYAERSSTAPKTFHPYFRDALLEVRVIGARKGYVYRPTLMQNGVEISGISGKYGISVTRIPVDRLASGFAQNIVTYLDEQIQLKPDREKGGIQTFYVDCPHDPITTLKFVFDVDKLPPDGTVIQQGGNTQHGYNTIIDPICYEYADEFAFNGGDLLVEYMPENTEVGVTEYLAVSYISGKRWFQTYVANRSVNKTFAPIGYGYAPAYTQWGDLIPVENAQFTLRGKGFSDFHGPVVFYAENNADTVVRGKTTVGAEVKIYDNETLLGSSIADDQGGWFFKTTGSYELGYKLKAVIDSVTTEVEVTAPIEAYTSGSHGSDTMDKGYATAVQKELTILVDDFILDLKKPFKKIARSVECIGTIHAMAWNTIPSKRFVLEQNYTYKLSHHGLWIDCVYNALEDLVMTTDGGCQHYFVGNTPLRGNTIVFWGGEKKLREKVVEGKWDTGPKGQYSNVFGVTTIHPNAGEYSSWVDCTYGVGTREFLDDDQPMYSHPRPTSKIYPRMFTRMPVEQGGNYKWRGGYYFGENQATAEYDNMRKTQAGWVLVKHDSSYTIL